jgi:hypothetical protein
VLASFPVPSERCVARLNSVLPRQRWGPSDPLVSYHVSMGAPVGGRRKFRLKPWWPLAVGFLVSVIAISSQNGSGIFIGLVLLLLAIVYGTWQERRTSGPKS